MCEIQRKWVLLKKTLPFKKVTELASIFSLDNDKIPAVVEWFSNWTRFNEGKYAPAALQEQFDIPLEAFNCTGPALL